MIKVVNGDEVEMTADEVAEFEASRSGSGSVQTSSTASLYATAKFTINGDEVTGVDVSSRLSGAFKSDVGTFWVFFTEPQPDTNYIAQAFDGGLIRCYVKPEDYNTDYLVVTTTDLQNNPADPTCLSLIITRVN